jgi:hypothetical protein
MSNQSVFEKPTEALEPSPADDPASARVHLFGTPNGVFELIPFRQNPAALEETGVTI